MQYPIRKFERMLEITRREVDELPYPPTSYFKLRDELLDALYKKPSRSTYKTYYAALVKSRTFNPRAIAGLRQHVSIGLFQILYCVISKYSKNAYVSSLAGFTLIEMLFHSIYFFSLKSEIELKQALERCKHEKTILSMNDINENVYASIIYKMNEQNRMMPFYIDDFELTDVDIYIYYKKDINKIVENIRHLLQIIETKEHIISYFMALMKIKRQLSKSIFNSKYRMSRRFHERSFKKFNNSPNYSNVVKPAYTVTRPNTQIKINTTRNRNNNNNNNTNNNIRFRDLNFNNMQRTLLIDEIKNKSISKLLRKHMKAENTNINALSETSRLIRGQRLQQRGEFIQPVQDELERRGKFIKMSKSVLNTLQNANVNNNIKRRIRSELAIVRNYENKRIKSYNSLVRGKKMKDLQNILERNNNDNEKRQYVRFFNNMRIVPANINAKIKRLDKFIMQNISNYKPTVYATAPRNANIRLRHPWKN